MTVEDFDSQINKWQSTYDYHERNSRDQTKPEKEQEESLILKMVIGCFIDDLTDMKRLLHPETEESDDDTLE